MDNGASLDTPGIPGGVQVVKISQFLHLNVKYFNGGTKYIKQACGNEIMPSVYYQEKDTYNILDPKLQKM